MTDNPIVMKNRKSVKLSPAEHRQFKKLVDRSTYVEVGEQLEVHRSTIRNVYLFGSGQQGTIDKIKATIAA